MHLLNMNWMPLKHKHWFVLLLALMHTQYVIRAQQKMPVIRAPGETALIVEGTDDITTWYLSPGARPDVYTLNKHTGERQVLFCTGLDTLSVRLKPGRAFDFVVLTTKGDSCFTRLQSPPLLTASSVETHDTLHFVLTEYNNIKLKVRLNGNDTLDLKFDSGTTGFLLTKEAIKNHGLSSLSNHRFNLGKLEWSGQTIRAVELSGHGTEGRFGWDIFDGRIIEIDYDEGLFIVHSQLDVKQRKYEKFAIEYTHGLFCLSALLKVKGRVYKNRFLFDNGYQRTIMLDKDLVSEQGYPAASLPVLRRTVMQNGRGENIPVLTVNNELLQIGKNKLRHVPAQLLATNNPAGFKIHIMGNEVLKRFNTILDFQKNYIYLKPNSLFYGSYIEQQKNGT